MPEISRFFGIIIRMFYNEHNPPHFHANYQECDIEIDIRTLEILRDNINFPKRAKLMVIEWAIEHRTELIENWENARQMNELHKIEPLKD